jgi:hypothetical protein
MTRMGALGAVKRKISDRLYRHLRADGRRLKDPGGHSGNDTASSAAGSHPEQPDLRTSHSRLTTKPTTGSPTRQLSKSKRSSRGT